MPLMSCLSSYLFCCYPQSGRGKEKSGAYQPVNFANYANKFLFFSNNKQTHIVICLFIQTYLSWQHKCISQAPKTLVRFLQYVRHQSMNYLVFRRCLLGVFFVGVSMLAVLPTANKLVCLLLLCMFVCMWPMREHRAEKFLEQHP